MKTLGQLLEEKGHDVWAVSPDTSVFEALQLMADKNIGAVLVVEKGKLVGIFSERDYARKVILKGKTSRDTRVREIMTPEVVCMKPEQSIEECMGVMTQRRIRHTPVLNENGSVTGVISIGDVVKAIISEQEFIIGQLEGYITGSR